MRVSRAGQIYQDEQSIKSYGTEISHEMYSLFVLNGDIGNMHASLKTSSQNT